MSVRRKLFLAMAGLIVGMSILTIFVTVLVVNGALRSINIADRSVHIGAIEEKLLSHYEKSGDRWGNLAELRDDLIDEMDGAAGILLLSASGEQLLAIGDENEGKIRGLGQKQSLKQDGAAIGTWYYYDPEAANVRKIQLGVSSSVTVLLIGFSLCLLLVSLVAAFLVARRVTAPLRMILPAIERLGEGGLGTQAPVLSQDEYGKVAASFNTMSLQLLRAEEARRSLVADVAHELRTPLSILQGQMELLQQAGESIEPHKLLPLQDELIRLRRLVDDLQLLSLAEAKHLVLRKQNSSIAALLTRIIDRFNEEAAEKNIVLRFQDRTGGICLPYDEYRMTQVFYNLVGNAIRYTPVGGSVTITAKVDRLSSEDGNEAVVTIADTGDGIGAEHLPYIFDRFYRTEEARTRSGGGMGLGLAIAKELVLAHEGHIEARSATGRGTTMIVKLPC